ncbi:Fur family transcriptional regulator [Sphingorhabdus sp.]|jgi:Fur family zinc uptake transcriptional regulator|uniref:Fur family transcriptional regulator n=1 Tax=Sphingorhabdus sp. TaxID=1902408 RepID=UPI003BB1F2E3|nr:transcriptional repressor [Sphingomonadales bacterium]MBK9431319.1 transcriptional repressor [Sphingomonadales bacterium]MBL0022776.1 transcriptional repressor [Sphingomonadales bacterium]
MASAHHHHEHHGHDLADAAQAALTAAGEQWTDMRADIFAVLATFDKPASAYDIADLVSQKRGKRVAPNSVYRILDLFVANNLASRVESANAYLANAHPGCLHDCIFLICDSCGTATHIDNDSLTGNVRKAAEATGFHVARPVVEVRGKCADCD